MADPIMFTETNVAIGLTVRRPREGPESELVRAFAAWAGARFESRSDRVAIFFEPALETRFPDIVIAVYDPRRFETWPPARHHLGLPDLKLLHHLYVVSKTDLPTASHQLGAPVPHLARRFERLQDAGLARRMGPSWRPVALARAFGIKRLIAVEAKVDDWRAVFGQACANRWFASETCVLTPVVCPGPQALRGFAEFGVGIFASESGGVVEVKEAARTALPSSYASWLFNEWIGRRAGLVGGDTVEDRDVGNKAAT